MIKTDFHHDTKFQRVGISNQAPKNESLPFFSLRTFLYGINFGLLGAMTNAFLSVAFFGEFKLFFGQIFVLFCLVTKGLNGAIITVIFTSVTTAIYANDPYLVVIFSLEMLVVHVLLRKGYFLFQSAMSYWLLIGIPLLLTLHALTSDASAELLFVNGVSRAINGLICVSIVAMICWFLPSNYVYGKYYDKPPKLASIIFSLCMLTVTLPAMVIALLFIWQSTFHNEKNVANDLVNVAYRVKSIVDLEMQRHIGGLNTVANIIESNSNTKLQPLLNATSKNFYLFESLLVTDKYGQILRAAPTQYSNILHKLKKKNLNHRDYFKSIKKNRKPVISDAIVGQGFGNNNLISLAAPINSQNSFNGIVQGAVLLENLSEHVQSNIASGLQFVITDKQGRIIARSASLNYPFMSNFDFQVYDEPLVTNVQTLKFNQDTYIYYQANTSNGWEVTILGAPSLVTSVLVEYFFWFIVVITFVLLAFAFIAKSLSAKITKPLVDIAEHYPDKEFHSQIIEESRVSSEMVKLTKKLIDSHQVMTNFHQQLSEQVHNKTKQLKQLNRELYSIAQKDSLTQLLNRAGFNKLAITSYRNCIRNHISMSMIFIDIDHFKQINDTYGHPFGDKCIIAVAKTIQKHCKRDTDIIGRYGGEEFIIMIIGGELNEHLQRIQLIKDEIQALTFRNGEQRTSMTISAGVSTVAKDFSIEYEDLLELADNQLYLSKRQGRNRISSVIR